MHKNDSSVLWFRPGNCSSVSMGVRLVIFLLCMYAYLTLIENYIMRIFNTKFCFKKKKGKGKGRDKERSPRINSVNYLNVNLLVCFTNSSYLCMKYPTQNLIISLKMYEFIICTFSLLHFKMTITCIWWWIWVNLRFHKVGSYKNVIRIFIKI